MIDTDPSVEPDAGVHSGCRTDRLQSDGTAPRSPGSAASPLQTASCGDPGDEHQVDSARVRAQCDLADAEDAYDAALDRRAPMHELQVLDREVARAERDLARIVDGAATGSGCAAGPDVEESGRSRGVMRRP